MVGVRVGVASLQEEEVWGAVLWAWQPEAGHSRYLADGPLSASSADRKASSLIYTLTAGPLQPSALQETKKQVSPVHHL